MVVSATACCCQDEVSAVKYVETSSFKPQVDPFRYLEGLGQSHVGYPVARSNKIVASQIASATQAGHGEQWYGRLPRCPLTSRSGDTRALRNSTTRTAPPIGPLIVRLAAKVGHAGTGAVVGGAVKVVVAARVVAGSAIDTRLGTIPSQVPYARVIRLPVRPRLERPDAVQRPATRNYPEWSVQVFPGKFPHVVKDQTLPDIKE